MNQNSWKIRILESEISGFRQTSKIHKSLNNGSKNMRLFSRVDDEDMNHFQK